MPEVSTFRLYVLRATSLILLAASGAPLAAQPDSTALARSTDSVFAAYDRPDAPGCALGVFRDGRMAYARGYGLADLERRVPIAPHTVFDLGSTSKQFAAATIVLLAQDGRLSLDDDVRRHVPELPAYGAPITIRHLLHHTSGLRDYIGVLDMGGTRFDDVTTPQDALDAIVRQRRLNFEPGTEHLYSNSGYFLLSVIVERVTGRSLRDVARERIFAPLGMTRTHYLGSYDDVVPDRAIGYAPRADGTMRADMPRWLQLGDGAVFSTVEELLRWDANFHEPVVGGRAMLDTLHERGVLSDGTRLEYAMGLIHDRHRGQPTVSHGGAWGGYRAELLRFPEHRFSVAVLCNLATADPSTLARRVADVHLASVLEPETPTVAPDAGASREPAGSPSASTARTMPTAADLAAYEGRYQSAELLADWCIVRAGEVLRVERPRRVPLVLRALEHDAFVAGSMQLRFVRAPDGAVTGFTLDVGRVRGIGFERAPDR